MITKYYKSCTNRPKNSVSYTKRVTKKFKVKSVGITMDKTLAQQLTEKMNKEIIEALMTRLDTLLEQKKKI